MTAGKADAALEAAVRFARRYVTGRELPKSAIDLIDEAADIEVAYDCRYAGQSHEITVPTLDGKVALKVPAGTQSHKIFRLRGKGMPALQRPGQQGDRRVEEPMAARRRATSMPPSGELSRYWVS